MMRTFASIFLASICASSLHAAYGSQPAQPIIQGKPQRQLENVSGDQDIRVQMDNIDKEIASLLNQRQELKAKADVAGSHAERIMAEALQHYQEQVNQQQSLQHEMQSIDGNVQELVQKKAQLAAQLKK